MAETRGLLSSNGQEALQISWAIAQSAKNILPSPALYLLDNDEMVREVADFLRSMGASNVYTLPNIYKNMGSLISTPSEITAERIKFLVNLGSAGIFLAEKDAITLKLPDPDFFTKKIMNLCEGDEFEKENLVKSLSEIGFQESVVCNSKQTFAIKGHVIDIAPQEIDEGFRVEIQGRKIVRLSLFNIFSQRSVAAVKKVTILPQFEFSFENNSLSLLESKIDLLKPDVYLTCKDAVLHRKYVVGLELYNLMLMPTVHWTKFFSSAILVGSNGRDGSSLSRVENLIEGLRSDPLRLNTIDLDFSLRPLQLKHKKQLSVVLKNRAKRLGDKIIVFVSRKYDSKAVSEINKVVGCESCVANDLFASLGADAKLWVVRGSVPFSFEDRKNRILAMKAEDISKKLPLKSEKLQDVGFILDQLAGYQPGDFVVHSDFGVCKFLGLEFKKFDDCFGELIKLQFADSLLYLPVDRISLIKKYAGFSAVNPPRLDSLARKNVWSAKKDKAKEVAGEFASALLKHFAVRRLPRGFEYPQKDELDDLFAADFEFSETPDQLRATDEVLRDLASPRIMDRLICGDTGFGKTEVALRAAFKVLSHGKQVAVMCPTNLLCEQNYNVFKSRLEKWGFKVGKLNRFLTTAERSKTVDMFNSGALDCVIGTTNLLSFKVAPVNLGLLIIDEEHKFGVRHKERFLNFPQTVDKLYLSATPLPRTLHLAVNDFRSLSLILTPPPDRKRHYTVIDEFNWELALAAIRRELNRGGKVFFVVSRVASMSVYVDRLKKELGEKTVGVAHGKMKSNQLEVAFGAFLAGHTKVLVATNIVESGLDLRDVNTVIVADSERFGLSQLYQLRGRVGRSAQQGFVYFFFSDLKNSTKEAAQRILALTDLTGLGDSFRLATRDLEIRGVGELLGKSQKGKADLVGYETFIELVQESLAELKAVPARFVHHFEPEVSSPWPCFIPVDYVPDAYTRLSLYRKISSLRYLSDFEEFKLFLDDAFGKPPQEVLNLLDLSEIKIFLRVLGVGRLKVSPGQVKWSFISPNHLSVEVIESLEKSGWSVNLNSLTTLINGEFQNFESVKFYTRKLFDIVCKNGEFSNSYFADA